MFIGVGFSEFVKSGSSIFEFISRIMLKGFALNVFSIDEIIGPHSFFIVFISLVSAELNGIDYFMG